MQTTRDADEKEFHRTRIAVGDLNEAIDFIDAAQRLTNFDPTTDVTHRALVCAAVIYYARPFFDNEHRNEKKRPPDAAASLVELSKDDVRQILSDPAGPAVHSEVLQERSKIVAHAESEFFKVEILPREWLADPQLSIIDVNFRAQRTDPSPDLKVLRQNAMDLKGHLTFYTLELLHQLRAKGSAATTGVV